MTKRSVKTKTKSSRKKVSKLSPSDIVLRAIDSGKNSFSIDDVTFLIDARPGQDRDVSTGKTFTLVKSHRSLRYYAELAKTFRPKTIFEIGMFQGGSMVLLDKLFQPDCLVGLDIAKDPIVPLENYCKTNPHIKTYYARSQDKPGTVMAARANFKNGIDFVVDDASHHYEKSKVTFKNIFPFVTKGGRYIIEDWQWSHKKAHQDPSHPWAHRPGLSNLVMELLLMSTANRTLDSIFLHDNVCSVTKGAGILPENAWDLDNILRGKSYYMQG